MLPYFRLFRKTARSEGTICARCSTGCAMWRATAARCGCCRTLFRPGPHFISRRGARWMRAASNRWWPMCSRSCGSRPGVRVDGGLDRQPYAPVHAREQRASRLPLRERRPFIGASSYDGARRRKRSKVHIGVDTLGHLLALTVTPARCSTIVNRSPPWPPKCSTCPSNNVEIVYVNQG